MFIIMEGLVLIFLAIISLPAFPPTVSCSPMQHNPPVTRPASGNISTECDDVLFSSGGSPCSGYDGTSGFWMDCGHRGITELNATWFPCNLTSLQAIANSLTVLRSTYFSHLFSLKWLGLRDNDVTKIEPGTFDSLVSLEYLNLEGNNLMYSTDSFPPRLFAHLGNLKTLRLADQYGDFRQTDFYPADFIFDLTGLQVLSMQVQATVDPLSFDPRFCQLRQLSRLGISGTVNEITNSSFHMLGCLDLIELSFFRLRDIVKFEPDALKPLAQSIRSLHVHRVNIGVQRALMILKPFKGCSMYEIVFDEVSLGPFEHARSIVTRDGVIDSESVVYLKDICVERVSLIKSDIYVISHTAFPAGNFRQSLKHLDLAFNDIQGSQVGLSRMLTLPHIEVIVLIPSLYEKRITAMEVKVRDQSKPLEGDIPTQVNLHTSCASDESTLRGNSHMAQSEAQKVEKAENVSTSLRHKIVRRNSPISVYVSRSLRAIVLHSPYKYGSIQVAVTITLVNADNLETFICRHCGLHYVISELIGFQNIKYADISYNDFSQYNSVFSKHLTGIEVSIMSHININTVQMSRESHLLFHSMTNMKSLDLSSNSLFLLSKGTFQNNKALESLSLRDNRFTTIPFDMSFTRRLRHLDLSKNAIFFLTDSHRAMLDSQARQTGTFNLVLSENLLSCGCSAVPFLLWLRHTTVLLDNGGNYTCVTSDLQLRYTSQYSDPRALWRACYGKYYLWFSLLLFSLIIISFLCVGFALRHGNYLRAALLYIFDKTFRKKSRDDYAIGVFIGYATRDYRFPCLRLLPFVEDLDLSTYVLDRDSLPNQDMATAIMEAMQNSWRIVLVVTASFLGDDQWSDFMVRSAVYAQGPENPSRVVVVVEERHRCELPIQLLAAVADENIVCLDRLVMCYELRQRLRTLLLRI